MSHTPLQKPAMSFTQKITKKGKPNIGILYSLSGNREASRYGHHVMNIVDKKFDYNAIPVDYDQIYYDAEMATNRYFHNQKIEKSDTVWRKKFLELLKKETKKCLTDKEIDGLIFPGDLYNYDKEPRHPKENRPLVSSMIFRTVLEEKNDINIPIMGICGGLQSYVNHVVGPSGIGRVKDMAHHRTHLAINHGASEPDEYLAAPYLDESLGHSGHIILPTKGSLLEEIAHEIQGPTENGRPNRIMMPAAHGAACRNDDITLQKLAERGAHVAAHCRDSIVEALEVRNDQGDLKAFFIQGHPESAIFEHNGHRNTDEIARICEEIMDRAVFDRAKEHMQERLQQGQSMSVA